MATAAETGQTESWSGSGWKMVAGAGVTLHVRQNGSSQDNVQQVLR